MRMVLCWQGGRAELSSRGAAAAPVRLRRPFRVQLAGETQFTISSLILVLVLAVNLPDA